MYALIERWQNSNKSQKDICKEAGVSFHVFKYWQKKQNIENDQREDAKKNNLQIQNIGTFIPLTAKPIPDFRKLQIEYPNGVTITCPGSITANQIKELIKLF